MNRAKKKKVEAREEVVEAPEETGITGEAERSPSPPPAEPAAAPSPGRMKRKQAQDEAEELYAEYKAYDELRSDAEKEFTLAQRIYDAKMRRIDAAQKGKGRGSASEQLYRIMQAEVDHLRADLKHSDCGWEASNAECNWLAQQCRVVRLENAKLRRELRKHRVRK